MSHWDVGHEGLGDGDGMRMSDHLPARTTRWMAVLFMGWVVVCEEGRFEGC